VSRAEELSKTMLVWRSILDGREGADELANQAGVSDRWKRAAEWSGNRRDAVQMLAERVQELLGDGFGFAWDSPAPGFVNQRKKAA
jgi:D-arabinose 1-dehydrogenase